MNTYSHQLRLGDSGATTSNFVTCVRILVTWAEYGAQVRPHRIPKPDAVAKSPVTMRMRS
jgi:hypothetical protein